MKSTTEIIQDLIEEIRQKKGLIDTPNCVAMAIIDVRWLGEELMKRSQLTEQGGKGK